MINLRMARSHSLIHVIVLLIGLSFATAAIAQSQPRIALIITNQDDRRVELKLQNPHADGDSIKAALETVNFDVTVVEIWYIAASWKTPSAIMWRGLPMQGLMRLASLYYSGHGAANGPQGHNDLLPTDANITHAAQLRFSALSVENIVNALHRRAAKMSFMVFDACRNVLIPPASARYTLMIQ